MYISQSGFKTKNITRLYNTFTNYPGESLANQCSKDRKK